MFTGIIEHLGTVKSMDRLDEHARLCVGEATLSDEVKNGDSVAVNGVCLTVVSKEGGICFEIGPQTLEKTNLSDTVENDIVNLELPLKLSDRLGGHFVQGHVDETAEIIEYEEKGATAWMTARLSQKAIPYLVPEGSIALDGVSLTIAKKPAPDTISIMLMDYTLRQSNLAKKRKGDTLNVEYDMMAKTIYHMTRQQV